MLTPDEEKQIASLLSSERWTFAKTMPGVPHEYIVRGRCVMTDAQFESIVRAQREHGVHRVWGKYNFPYLYIDGYKYWTMGDAIEETIILNRQKLFSEFDSLELAGEPSCNEDAAFIAGQIASRYNGRHIFEAGCGCGALLSQLPIPVDAYRGCDPSRKAIEHFRNLHPDYAKCVLQRSFEECYRQWIDSDEVILATSGTPNFIMQPYLQMVASTHRDVILSFYRDGYFPPHLSAMHHFNYTVKDIQSIFAGYRFEEVGEFVVVMK